MTWTWFKLPHALPTDIKLRLFSPSEKWAWIALLCLASQSEQRGTVKADDEDIADFCEFKSVQDWLYFKDKLIAKGLIELSIGGIQIIDWEKQQEQKRKPSDTPEATRERKRRQREKEKLATVTHTSRDVTRCHATDQIRLDQDPDQDLKADPDLIHSPIAHAHAQKESEYEPAPLAHTEPTDRPTQTNEPTAHPVNTRSPETTNRSDQTGSTPIFSGERYIHPTQQLEDRLRGVKPAWDGDEEFFSWLCARMSAGTEADRRLWARRILSKALYDAQALQAATDYYQTFTEYRCKQLQNAANLQGAIDPTPTPAQTAPKAYVDMSPQEQADYRAEIARMRQKTAGDSFAQLGTAIAAQALQADQGVV